MTTFSDFSLQIFSYNIGIFDNYPMIKFEDKEQLIEFVIKLEKIDYSKDDNDDNIKIYRHFVINNPQLLPSELEKYKYPNTYPLNEYNISILYSLKDKFFNKEQQFIEWLEKNLSFKENLE